MITIIDRMWLVAASATNGARLCHRSQGQNNAEDDYDYGSTEETEKGKESL